MSRTLLAEKGQGGTPHSMGLEGIRDRRSPRVRAGEAGEGQTTGASDLSSIQRVPGAPDVVRSN